MSISGLPGGTIGASIVLKSLQEIRFTWSQPHPLVIDAYDYSTPVKTPNKRQYAMLAKALKRRKIKKDAATKYNIQHYISL